MDGMPGSEEKRNEQIKCPPALLLFPFALLPPPISFRSHFLPSCAHPYTRSCCVPFPVSPLRSFRVVSPRFPPRVFLGGSVAWFTGMPHARAHTHTHKRTNTLTPMHQHTNKQADLSSVWCGVQGDGGRAGQDGPESDPLLVGRCDMPRRVCQLARRDAGQGRVLEIRSAKLNPTDRENVPRLWVVVFDFAVG